MQVVLYNGHKMVVVVLLLYLASLISMLIRPWVWLSRLLSDKLRAIGGMVEVGTG